MRFSTLHVLAVLPWLAGVELVAAQQPQENHVVRPRYHFPLEIRRPSFTNSSSATLELPTTTLSLPPSTSTISSSTSLSVSSSSLPSSTSNQPVQQDYYVNSKSSPSSVVLIPVTIYDKGNGQLTTVTGDHAILPSTPVVSVPPSTTTNTGFTSSTSITSSKIPGPVELFNYDSSVPTSSSYSTSTSGFTSSTSMTSSKAPGPVELFNFGNSVPTSSSSYSTSTSGFTSSTSMTLSGLLNYGSVPTSSSSSIRTSSQAVPSSNANTKPTPVFLEGVNTNFPSSSIQPTVTSNTTPNYVPPSSALSSTSTSGASPGVEYLTKPNFLLSIGSLSSSSIQAVATSKLSISGGSLSGLGGYLVSGVNLLLSTRSLPSSIYPGVTSTPETTSTSSSPGGLDYFKPKVSIGSLSSLSTPEATSTSGSSQGGLGYSTPGLTKPNLLLSSASSSFHPGVTSTPETTSTSWSLGGLDYFKPKVSIGSLSSLSTPEATSTSGSSQGGLGYTPGLTKPNLLLSSASSSFHPGVTSTPTATSTSRSSQGGLGFLITKPNLLFETGSLSSSSIQPGATSTPGSAPGASSLVPGVNLLLLTGSLSSSSIHPGVTSAPEATSTSRASPGGLGYSISSLTKPNLLLSTVSLSSSIIQLGSGSGYITSGSPKPNLLWSGSLSSSSIQPQVTSNPGIGASPTSSNPLSTGSVPSSFNPKATPNLDNGGGLSSNSLNPSYPLSAGSLSSTSISPSVTPTPASTSGGFLGVLSSVTNIPAILLNSFNLPSGSSLPSSSVHLPVTSAPNVTPGVVPGVVGYGSSNLPNQSSLPSGNLTSSGQPPATSISQGPSSAESGVPGVVTPGLLNYSNSSSGGSPPSSNVNPSSLPLSRSLSSSGQLPTQGTGSSVPGGLPASVVTGLGDVITGWISQGPSSTGSGTGSLPSGASVPSSSPASNVPSGVVPGLVGGVSSYPNLNSLPSGGSSGQPPASSQPPASDQLPASSIPTGSGVPGVVGSLTSGLPNSSNLPSPPSSTGSGVPGLVETLPPYVQLPAQGPSSAGSVAPGVVTPGLSNLPSGGTLSSSGVQPPASSIPPVPSNAGSVPPGVVTTINSGLSNPTSSGSQPTLGVQTSGGIILEPNPTGGTIPSSGFPSYSASGPPSGVQPNATSGGGILSSGVQPNPSYSTSGGSLSSSGVQPNPGSSTSGSSLPSSGVQPDSGYSTSGGNPPSSNPTSVPYPSQSIPISSNSGVPPSVIPLPTTSGGLGTSNATVPSSQPTIPVSTDTNVRPSSVPLLDTSSATGTQIPNESTAPYGSLSATTTSGMSVPPSISPLAHPSNVTSGAVSQNPPVTSLLHNSTLPAVHNDSRPTVPLATGPNTLTTEPTSSNKPISVQAPVVPASSTTLPASEAPSNYVPSSIMVQPTSSVLPSQTTSTESNSPGTVPTELPQVIAPAGGIPQPPQNSTLIQLGFNGELKYTFVATTPISASQIFLYVPIGVAYALQLNTSQVLMQSIRPYDTTKKNGYVTTLAMAFIPSDMVDVLDLQLHTQFSRLYEQQDPPARTLMGFLDPTIPLIASQGLVSSSSSGPGNIASSGNPNNGGYNNDGTDGGDGGANNATTNVRPATVGIAMTVVCGAMMYGAGMFYVARRYRNRRQLHQRSRSLPDDRLSGPPGTESVFRTLSPHGGRNSRHSGRSNRTQMISAPVTAENSLGWN